MFYLTMDSSHFIYGYMASDRVKDHSDSERRNPLHRLPFPIRSKIFYMHHPTARIVHTIAIVTPVNGSTMKDRMLLPQSYLPLRNHNVSDTTYTTG